jgi:hypothetical protein
MLYMEGTPSGYPPGITWKISSVKPIEKPLVPHIRQKKNPLKLYETRQPKGSKYIEDL